MEPTLRDRLALAMLPLSTGGAVLVTILVVHDSLLWPTLMLLVGGAVTAGVVARKLPAPTRHRLGRRLRLGLVAGVAATAAYDLVRWLLFVTTPWSVDPFGAFPVFGQLLIGADATASAHWVAGTLFHVANGLGFAIGYVLVVSRPTVLTAVIWAMVLETFTILLYPDWLGITAIGELLNISVIGHLAYGIVLGLVSRAQ